MASDALAWPFFELRHRALKSRFDGWAAGYQPPADAAALLAALGEAGWLEPALPEGSGSECFDCRALFLLREALARLDARADAALLAQGLAAAPIVLAGTPEQRARLAAARRGSWRIAAAGL